MPAGEKGRVTERDVRNYRPADGPKTSPLAEKMAADLGIDLRLLKKGGRIMAADLARALRDTQCRCAVQEAVREERRAMNGMRRAISHNMLASHMTSPTVTYDISVDMANMQDYRAQLMAGGLKVSYTDLLVKFVAKALTEFPLLNCSIEGDEIIFKHYINMALPWHWMTAGRTQYYKYGPKEPCGNLSRAQGTQHSSPQWHARHGQDA